jgi:hypothetical protein
LASSTKNKGRQTPVKNKAGKLVLSISIPAGIITPINLNIMEKSIFYLSRRVSRLWPSTRYPNGVEKSHMLD